MNVELTLQKRYNNVIGIYMEWNDIVLKIREQLFLTQTELAKLLGVSFATVNRWENKQFVPSMKDKRKISDFCKKHNIDIGGLING